MKIYFLTAQRFLAVNQLFVVYLLDKWHIEKNKIIKFLYFLIILELYVPCNPSSKVNFNKRFSLGKILLTLIIFQNIIVIYFFIFLFFYFFYCITAKAKSYLEFDYFGINSNYLTILVDVIQPNLKLIQQHGVVIFRLGQIDY